MTDAEPAEPGDAPVVWRRGPAIVVAATFFMEILDGVILFTALPTIAREFGIGVVDAGIAATAYLVAVVTFIPLGGWLASRWGGRRVFAAAIVLFTLASALCALSPDLATLTAGRILQGVGGALMVPVGNLIILRSTRKTELLRAIAYITWPALLAPVVAPVLGGVITATLGWRWIFLINVPLGAAALIAALLLIRDTHPPARGLDWRGLILTTLTVFGTVAGLELIASERVLAGLAVVAAALAVGVLAVRWLRRAPAPLLDLGTFRLRTFREVNSAGLLYRLVCNSVPFLIPLLLQDALGIDIVEASAVVTALFVGNVAIKPLTTPLLRRVSFRLVLVVAASGVAATLFVAGTWGEGTPLPAMAAVLLLSGVFRSVGFTAYNTLQLVDVPPQLLPSANTTSATLQQVAGALGVALPSMVLGLLLTTAAAQADAVLPYRAAFLAMGALAVVAAISAATLPRGSGDVARGLVAP